MLFLIKEIMTGQPDEPTNQQEDMMVKELLG